MQYLSTGLSPSFPFRGKRENSFLFLPISSPLMFLENTPNTWLSGQFHTITPVKLAMTLPCQVWLLLCPLLVQPLNTLTWPTLFKTFSAACSGHWTHLDFLLTSWLSLQPPYWDFFILTLTFVICICICPSKDFISAGPGSADLPLRRLATGGSGIQDQPGIFLKDLFSN